MSDEVKKPQASSKPALKLAILAIVLALLGTVVMVSVKPSYMELYSEKEINVPQITQLCFKSFTPLLPIIFAIAAVAIALLLPNKELAEVLNMIIIIMIFLGTIMFFIGMSMPLGQLIRSLS
jgi:hypothetical protein